MRAEPQNPSQISDDRECDLVMKGGITSGIVYPPLVIKLHEAGYRFRKVGGTSAGAIAAAVTAAAEMGGEAGFRKLDEVRRWLGTGANLLNLFQASRSTAPLLRTFLIYPKLKFLRLFLLKLTVALLLGDLLFFLLGAGLGVGLSFLFAWLVGGGLTGWGLIFPFLLGWIGALLVCAAHLYLVLTRSVPKNYFGICTGRGRNPFKLDRTALTDWLALQLNDLAGLGTDEDLPPLTFGDLWGNPGPGQERRIDLRMMTSNLSQNRPFVLPFDDVYLFKQKDFEKLFPPRVVTYMTKHQRTIGRLRPPAGYFFLPEAKDLPVIVATRMSLSFPVLLSMVPLYSISHRAFSEGTNVRFEIVSEDEHSTRIVVKRMSPDGRWVESSEPLSVEEKDLQRNWFSDGGICSNFPIHFFDSWLPTRPTFGVTLTSQLGDQGDSGATRAVGASGEQQQRVDPQRFAYTVQQPLNESASMRATPVSYNRDVYLPQPGSEAAPEFVPIPSLPKFLGSIFRTAQNYRDNMQAVLPSYYERIVQIRLSDQEGGLNLEMPPEVIEKVVEKGGEAGEVLTTEFDFAKHQWVRFRVLMGQMEKALKKMDASITQGAAPFDYLKLMENQREESMGYPYRRDENWCENAAARLARMGETISGWVPPSLSEEPPLPEPELRCTPEI
jgi:predicted acylesterase/phospholipase RssA